MKEREREKGKTHDYRKKGSRLALRVCPCESKPKQSEVSRSEEVNGKEIEMAIDETFPIDSLHLTPTRQIRTIRHLRRLKTV